MASHVRAGVERKGRAEKSNHFIFPALVKAVKLIASLVIPDYKIKHAWRSFVVAAVGNCFLLRASPSIHGAVSLSLLICFCYDSRKIYKQT